MAVKWPNALIRNHKSVQEDRSKIIDTRIKLAIIIIAHTNLEA